MRWRRPEVTSRCSSRHPSVSAGDRRRALPWRGRRTSFQGPYRSWGVRDCRRHVVFIAKLDAAVDRWTHHDTTCKRFVRVVGNLECLAELVRDVAVIMSRADGIDPSIFRFKALFRAGEAFRREDRSGQTVLRGASRMKALGHGAEHFLKTHRLRSRQSNRPKHLLLG